MEKCKKNNCKYAQHISGAGKVHKTELCCCYILETGHSRGCPADQCDKYEPKKRGAKKEWKMPETRV